MNFFKYSYLWIFWIEDREKEFWSVVWEFIGVLKKINIGLKIILKKIRLKKDWLLCKCIALSLSKFKKYWNYENNDGVDRIVK